MKMKLPTIPGPRALVSFIDMATVGVLLGLAEMNLRNNPFMLGVLEGVALVTALRLMTDGLRAGPIASSVSAVEVAVVGGLGAAAVTRMYDDQIAKNPGGAD